METRELSEIKRAVVHCSDSEFGDAAEIDRWHKARGWDGIGYHYVILNGHRSAGAPFDPADDGLVETGRQLSQVGAHVRGHNTDTVGICLIGKHHFTGRQLYRALPDVLVNLMLHLGLTETDIFGHYELDPAKTCPNIDADLIRWQALGGKFNRTGGL